MSIARETSSLFSSVARERGRDVFHHRAINIVRGDAWAMTASTLGSTEYLIDLVRNNANHITARCTCHEFAGRELCRHIWAALLLAEKKDLLTGPGGRPHKVTLSADFSTIVIPQKEKDGDRDADAAAARPADDRPLTWREQLALLRGQTEGAAIVSAAYRPTSRQILYVFDMDASRSGQGVIMQIGWQDRRTTGDWGRVQIRPYLSHELAGALDTSDIAVITLLEGASSSYIREISGDTPRGVLRNTYHLTPVMLDLLWPRLIATGRAMIRLPGPTPELPVITPAALDDGAPWELCLDVREVPSIESYRATLRLKRGTDTLAVDENMTLVKGALFLHDTIARVDDRGVLPWMDILRRDGGITVPMAEGFAFVNEVVTLPRVPQLLLPDSLRLDDTRVAPECILRLHAGKTSDPERPLVGALLFGYQGYEVSWADTSERLLQQEPRRLLVRDPVIERNALDELTNEGVRVAHRADGRGLQLELASDLLPILVRTLTGRGWRVEAENTRYRAFTGSRFTVTSGIDWFELEGVLEFGDASVSLAALLANCPRGESFVILDDGSVGVVPEEWLARRELLQLCGSRDDNRLRFTRGQAVLLDHLLAKQSSVTVDEPFARLREALRHFDGVDDADPPDDFAGTLRPYQRQGLGWLLYLQEFGFGGCLADDMGLGKTVQVLALLASRQASVKEGQKLEPSLVVMPRSLIHNWQEEAARFVPSLKVMDHTGPNRLRDPASLSSSDAHAVLTTYGTLLRDAAWLADISFDCIVLDEAHAIKNASSETARAVRLLRGRQRLALTGTPVQNHLGELWSLFDFLNPGLLGSAKAFDKLYEPNSDPESRRILAQTFRPFLLRRTKSQVAADLPPKVEQTIYCQLEGPERDYYDQLRVSFREAIMNRIDREGFGRSRMFILEGLLRLRQAACHPGLLDPGKTTDASAKIDMLLERLREVVEEGHKAIVFSQFVKLLDIARLKLDREGLMYASLDGRTRHRGTVVDQFQRDPNCRIFLISLKAGGLGLNLTAADYVFLLDPWWNPAIEAQAIDRAHRIGQTRQVFAYRLIAQDTIDEKVLELQQRKQELADAVMGKGDELMQRLTREDLERLLS
jgi:superfamily II DNA or RNA helicase